MLRRERQTWNIVPLTEMATELTALDPRDTVSISVRLPRRLHARLKAAAVKEGRSMSQLVEEALRCR